MVFGNEYNQIGMEMFFINTDVQLFLSVSSCVTTYADHQQFDFEYEKLVESHCLVHVEVRIGCNKSNLEQGDGYLPDNIDYRYVKLCLKDHEGYTVRMVLFRGLDKIPDVMSVADNPDIVFLTGKSFNVFSKSQFQNLIPFFNKYDDERFVPVGAFGIVKKYNQDLGTILRHETNL